MFTPIQEFVLLSNSKRLKFIIQRYMKYVNSVLGDANLWNDLSFSLCAAPSICHIVTTSNE